MSAGDGRGLKYHLNRKAGTLVGDLPTVEAQRAANLWAGSTALDLLGALNEEAGNGTGTLAAPVLTLGATSTGGVFAAGAYFWKVTAVNANGETVGSNEVTKTLVLNDQQALSWTAVNGATGYRVYRGTAANTENTLVATTAAANYTDTGTAGSAATVPGANTATKTPVRALAGVLNQLAGTTSFEVAEAAARIP